MHTFQDRHGKTRTIEVYLSHLEKISRAMNLKVYDIEALATISGDLIRQCELLWLASDSTESFEEFSRCLTLQSVEDGMSAFLDELCYVLPTRCTLVLRESQKRAKQLRAELTEKAVTFLNHPA